MAPRRSTWSLQRFLQSCGDTAPRSSTWPMQILLRFLEGEKVTIVVGSGEEQKEFTVLKALLCLSSKWFAAALEEDRFKEGETKRVSFPDDSPAVFEPCLFFFYTRDLCFTSLNDETNLAEEVELACKIWIFGDKLELPDLQNCAMMRLCYILCYAETNEIELEAPTLILCLQNTTPDAPLRTVALEYIMHRVKNGNATIHDFNKAGELDGFTAEMFELQGLWCAADGEGFPRFLKPLKNKGVFAAEAFHDVDESSAEDEKEPDILDDRSYNALNSRKTLDENVCVECGLFPRWKEEDDDVQSRDDDTVTKEKVCSDCWEESSSDAGTEPSDRERRASDASIGSMDSGRVGYGYRAYL